MKAPKKARLRNSKMPAASLPTKGVSKAAPGMTGYKRGGMVKGKEC